MTAYGSFILLEDGPHGFTPEGIVDQLKMKGIKFGHLPQEEIKAMLDALKETTDNVVLAKGQAPIPSTNDTLTYFFEMDSKKTPKENEHGNVDYRELGIIQNALAGQVLAHCERGVTGRAGMNVMGQLIGIKQPVRIPLATRVGKGVAIRENGDEIFAEIDGQIVFIQGKKVSVTPIFQVAGSVDFSTGNIDFRGSVVVSENVHAGFSIRASGNIEINGLVEAANLYAEGDIIIRGGVQGGHNSVIEGKGTLHALYLQNAKVKMDGDVIVSDSIMHSAVSAKMVKVDGKRGLLVGGEIEAMQSIQAKIFGSPLATKTVLRIEPDTEFSARLLEIDLEITRHQQTITKATEAIRAFEKMIQQHVRLTPEQQRIVERLQPTVADATVSLRSLQEERVEITEALAHLPEPMIQIAQEMHPGVSFQGYSGSYVCEEHIGGCKFLLTGHGWKKIIS